MFSMQGTSSSGGNADPATQQKELSLSFATCRELGAPEGTASAAQAGSASLAANVTFQAKESLLRCTTNVMHLRHAAVVTAAASMVHNHLGLIDGVHLNLPWGRHRLSKEFWESVC